MGLPLLMAGCATSQYANYGAIPGERFPLPAIPASEVKPELRRTEVAFGGDYAAGTIVVNTPERRLYYVLGNGRAIRYGIGVGRQGLALRGNATIGRKAEWPSWTPTANMMRRDSRNRRYAGDTMFRIHGTNQPSTIGKAVSSGCIRMLNHDVIDLYERVTPGTRVVVIQS
jgi:lipoprotein-anchoring transpeptidase ErfK/SrfK